MRPELNVETRGRGPDLVMLHGWGLHRGVLAPLADALAPRFRLHLVDLPGYGGNAGSAWAPTFDELVDALAARLPAAAWLGWSLGGQLSLALAHRHPDTVRALVLLACNPGFVAGGDWDGMPGATFEAFEAGLQHSPEQALRRFTLLCARGGRAPGPVRRRLEAACLPAPRPSALAHGLDWLRDHPQRGVLASLRAPSTWIAGINDGLVPVAAVRAAALAAPGGRVHVVQGAGHAPFLDAPAAVAAHVVRALDGRRVA
ncbi:MAG: alpha/beta fold hydrolase [Xanthomonadales bacterium]|nr:alpha/beta fold hydrolase [Xanthomonadales bacterium]